MFWRLTWLFQFHKGTIKTHRDCLSFWGEEISIP